MPVLEPHEVAFVFNSQTGLSKVFVGNGENGETQLGLVSRCAFTAEQGRHPVGAVEIHILEGTPLDALGRVSRDVQNSIARTLRLLMDHPLVVFTTPLGTTSQVPPAPPASEVSRFDREDPL